MRPRAALAFVRAVLAKWQEDDVTRLAGAVAFFTLLSLAPMLVLGVAAAGFFFSEQTLQTAVVSNASRLVGPEAAEVIRSVFMNAATPDGSALAITVGVLTLIYSTTNVFLQLQRALNEVWDVAARPGRGLAGMLRDRLFAFLLVLITELLLLALPLLDIILDVLGRERWGYALGQLVEWGLMLSVFTLVFAAMFRFLPSARIGWRDVWVGAAFTALLFTLARLPLQAYLGGSAVTSFYGAAGSLMVLLLWIYVSALILFLGAEFTQVWVSVRGGWLVPLDYAVTFKREHELKRQEVKALIAQARGETKDGT